MAEIRQISAATISRIPAYPGDATRTVTVPVHANRDLKPGTLRSIIRQAGLTVEEFSDPL